MGNLDAGSAHQDGGRRCEETCSIDGRTRCANGVAQICSSLDGCLVWVEVGGSAEGICDASSCIDTCSQVGATRCLDGQVERCATAQEGCLAWQQQPACTSGLCADGWSCQGCVNHCAHVGETLCSAGVVRACETDAAGCLDWGTSHDCAGAACVDAESCDHCVNSCPQPGATSCANGNLRTCVADANGCLAWNAGTSCEGGHCADAASCATCENHCPSAGETSCESATLRTCLADQNGCLDWNAGTSCNDGFCADAKSCGNCTHTCAALGNTRCVNGTLQTCVANALGCRSWNVGTACAEGFCADADSCGSCSHGCPTTGDTQCALGSLVTCVADAKGCRAWNAGTQCADGFCADAKSCGHCDHGCASTGGTACTAGVLSTCVADAKGCRDWNDGTDCADGFCQDEKSCGVCTNQCVEGTTRCSAGNLVTCVADANGCSAWNAPQTCEANRCVDTVDCYDCAEPVYVDIDSQAVLPTGRSWELAFKSLDAAFDALKNRPGVCKTAEVWVAEGRYVPTTSQTAGKVYASSSVPVAIYGGFSGNEQQRNQRNPELHKTVVSGDVMGNDTATGNRQDNLTQLLYLGGRGNSSLDGLTFYGANLSSSSVVSGSAQHLTVENVVFAGNLGSDAGANRVLDGSGNTLVVRNSLFVSNIGTQVYTAFGRLELDGLLVADARLRGLEPGIKGNNPGTIRRTMLLGTRFVGTSHSQFGGYVVDVRGGHLENVLIAGNEATGLYVGGTSQATNITLFGNLIDAQVSGSLKVANSVISAGSFVGESVTNYAANQWSAFDASITGTWGAASSYDAGTFQTVFSISGATYVKDTLKGRLLAPRAGERPWALIVGNEGSTLRVWGIHEGIPANTAFAIHDLRPSPTGPLVDTATDARAPCGDIVGADRIDRPSTGNAGTKADIGAYEVAGTANAICSCDECPALGQKECLSGDLRECKLGSDNCLVWAEWSDCGSNECLDDQTCEPVCTDSCGPVSTTQCASGELRTCSTGADGCLAWSTFSPCASGSCTNATTCAPTCASNCPANGQTQCQSGQIRTCNLGGNGCLAWGSYSACASGTCGSGTTCATVEPVSGVCDRKSNAFQCFEYTGAGWTNAKAQGQCAADGTWASSCPTGTVLGKCVNQGGASSLEAVTVWFYSGSPFTAQQLQTMCGNTGGTWQ